MEMLCHRLHTDHEIDLCALVGLKRMAETRPFHDYIGIDGH